MDQSSDQLYDCIIIGAGPSGLAAAIAAAEGGVAVLVLEKNEQAGRKLLLTGGGHCNIRDPRQPALEALEAFGRQGRFLRQSLAAFNWFSFIEQSGVEVESADGPTRVQGGGQAILKALLARAVQAGAEVRPISSVRAVEIEEDAGFSVETFDQKLGCRRLLLATGGMTFPATGSSGDGQQIAEVLGHQLEPMTPALGGIGTQPAFKDLAGMSLADAELTFKAGRKKRLGARGGLLFTHEGISGPAALNTTLELARAGRSEGEMLSLDFLPSKSHQEVVDILIARSRSETKRSIRTAGLGQLMPVRLLSALAELSDLRPERRMGSLSMKEYEKLAATIKGLELQLSKVPDPENAMVTVGGVATDKIDPRTMESRLVPGLFLAGELLAPAGPCGGYNLLMAFATGDAAGRGIAK
jgi:predicted Rossmann fold flavoprotein